jgi:hypothetical protein
MHSGVRAGQTCVRRRGAMVHVPEGKDDLRRKSDQRQQREPTMPPQRAHDGPPSLCYTITLRDRAWSSEKGRKEALSGKRVADRIQCGARH